MWGRLKYVLKGIFWKCDFIIWEETVFILWALFICIFIRPYQNPQSVTLIIWLMAPCNVSRLISKAHTLGYRIGIQLSMHCPGQSRRLHKTRVAYSSLNSFVDGYGHDFWPLGLMLLGCISLGCDSESRTVSPTLTKRLVPVLKSALHQFVLSL